ncbi:putative NAD(P)-binding protein [Martelella mediterranea]|uniref:Putative NAD(P)-binding protein n=1 Tax=Martelella mediterranea TaxID=293089 RepID=A0A4R3NND0_9HYPH|nr:putative NAD(P)-binding protein [Martelella mediterranea]
MWIMCLNFGSADKLDKGIFPILLRKIYADKNRQKDIVRASGLDWTIVRPTILTNKPGTQFVRALTDPIST